MSGFQLGFHLGNAGSGGVFRFAFAPFAGTLFSLILDQTPDSTPSVTPSFAPDNAPGIQKCRSEMIMFGAKHLETH